MLHRSFPGLSSRAQIVIRNFTPTRFAPGRVSFSTINTVTKLLVDVGTACDLYQNEHLKNLPCKRVQVDEIWSFVAMKRSGDRLTPGNYTL